MFTDKLYTIQNHKGIPGQCSYAVWSETGRRSTIYAFDTIGGESTVKAVFASVFGRSGRLDLKVRRYRPGQVYIDQALGGYRCHKETLVQHPTLYRWDFYAEPHPDDPYVIFFDFLGENVNPSNQMVGEEPGPLHQSEIDAFYQAMEQHTIWPIRPPWAKMLFKRGKAAGLIRDLSHTKNIAYAYLVKRTGWAEVLEKAVMNQELVMPQ
jgi:hypothetical protein